MGYIVLDFETGGTDVARHGLVSMGLIELDDELHEIGRQYTLIHDYEDKPIGDEALMVNGITREEIRDKGMPIEKAMGILHGALLDNVLVAHNVAFDAGFLKVRGLLREEAIDTMDLAWKVWPYQKAKLGMVYHRVFGQELNGAHNAMADVEATAELLRWFVKNKPEIEPLKLRPIDYNRWKK